jgi:hypothetical protein
MNEGLSILLARMDSHPEEFSMSDYSGDYYNAKWAPVINPIMRRGRDLTSSVPEVLLQSTDYEIPFLSDEEVKVVYAKMMGLQAQSYTNAVMRILLQEPEPANMQAYAAPYPSITSITSGNSNAKYNSIGQYSSLPTPCKAPLGSGALQGGLWQIAQAYDVNSPEFP